ncbi:mucin-binding protein [Streptococcus parasanguinis]|uniref:mucin-binding protein n=1 Tax=Streptococcus parasanguinis TaxID=1318 RepID=UPI0018A92E39|nr:YSIRK-type signal peptide-containing protein [Streptococcus parasanguinis]
MNFDRKQRFSIRKYSIGVASVLIGSVLAGTTIASADTEVKIDDASKAPVTSTQEAPKVSAVSAQEASTQEAPTYSANAALVSSEKAEAPKVEAKTETPAKEQASQAEVKENAKDSKNEAKTEETVSEVKAPETEVKSEESEVKEAEKKADSTDKKSEDKPVDLKKEQLDVDKKVPGLDLKNATENPDGGFNIAFSKEAQEQYRASLEAYIARRRNYNRRSSFRAAGADTSTDPDYEFKKVMTPILPGFYADQESIRSLVIDPDNVGDFNFDVWYKKLGSIVLVDEQGNYITPTGETTANQADAAHKQYENDSSDPTRAWFTKVPTIPTGWEVKPGQNVYGYDAARQTVNPNQKDDLDAIGRDTKIVIVKQAQKAIIKYVNENGNVELSRDEVVGKSGEAIDYSTNEKVSSYRRRGFELVSDGFYDAANKNFDFDASVDQEFTVVLRERIEPIDPDKPTPTPDQPVDPKDPDTPKWPDPVKDIVNKDDVTRTVKYVYEDGSKAKEDVSETLRFKRFAYVNLVTGHIDYRPWTTTDDTFDAVTSPVIPGYTADKLVVPAVSGVKAGDADRVEIVTYVKDAQKAIIKYVNEKGNVELSRDEVNGKSGEAIDYSTATSISSYKRQGYELVNDGFTNSVNKNFDFDASVDQEFVVTLRERIEPIDPDKPTPTPDKPVDPNDPDTPKWPDPVKDIVNKETVTRTIHYVYEDGSKAKDDVTETLYFKRFAYVNLVTGHVDYRQWTSNDRTFDSVLTPTIKGYTADKNMIPAVTGVEPTAPDIEETVTYVKDAQKAIVKYVNEKGNVELSRDEVLGKSGDAINYSTAAKISSYKRQGYELVSDGFTSASNKNFDFDTAFDQEFTVVLRERIEPIDPDKPTPTPDKPVDPNDPDTPKWPDPVKDIVNKDDVTRTVKYVYEDGSKAKEDVSETLHFKRFAYVNLVTGHIDYRPWTTTDDTFDAVTSPVIKGYTADKLVVPAVSGVQAGAADTVEVVTYVKDAQKAIIKYVNEKGNVEVARDTVNGKSGEVIAYTTTDKINELHRKGYELVSDGFTSASSKNFDFDASVDQEFTVVVRERVVPVGPEDPDPTPDTPYDPTDPNTPNWPKNVDKIQNRRAVATRTIRYFITENGVKVPKPIRERVVFERTVLVNLVTGEMTPQAWKLVSVTQLDNEVENKPVVRTRRALSEGLAPRALETSLARPASHTRSRRSLVIADSPEESTVSLSAVNPEPVVATRSARRSRRSLSAAPATNYTFAVIPTPVRRGEYADKASATARFFDPDLTAFADFTEDITYELLGHIQLVDQNGNVLAETIYKNNETDATKAAPTALPAIPAGYKIKEGQTVYGYDATAGTVDPNNPTDPDAIGRNTTILLELQAVPRQETKVVNETIHYKDAITGETLAPDHTDQVTFRRVVMVNPATNEVLSATSWVADNGDTTFDAVTSPVIEGYEASPLVVDAITGLTAESKDFVTTVLYRKKAVPTPQPDPVKPDPVKPDPVKPNPVKPEPVKPEPVKPEPVKPEPTKPATPDAPKAPTLPETGVTDASTVTLLGAALGLVGLAGLAKRKRDENE